MRTFRRLMNATVLVVYNIPIAIRDIMFALLSIGTLVSLVAMTVYYKGYLSTVTLLYSFYSMAFLLSAVSCIIISKMLELLIQNNMLQNIRMQPLMHILCYLLLFLSMSYTLYTYESYNTIFYMLELVFDGVICVLLIHFIVALMRMLQVMPTLNKVYHQRGVQ